MNKPADQIRLQHISSGEFWWTWARVAALSFGGPAGQIAVMHRILVDEKKWIDESRFLHALNYCMLLPGPEAQQLATYIGWLLRSTRGGLIAGSLFVLPGFVSILLLSILYCRFQEFSLIQAMFFGLKSAVIAIVFSALLRIGKRILQSQVLLMLALLSFVAMYGFGIAFPWIIAAAGIFGYVSARYMPHLIQITPAGHSSTTAGNPPTLRIDTDSEPRLRDAPNGTPRRSLAASFFTLAIGLLLWFGPIAGLSIWLGNDSVFVQEGWFFSKAAMVTYGGAYSVLSYIAQEAVENYHWLRPNEMLDGLGMAETTPGPLVMVVQFVGFMGAYRDPGSFSPIFAGCVGSCITTWVTFAPCFLWIFLGAPYVETIREHRPTAAALAAITASVVGVILNLAVWFSLHTLFDELNRFDFGFGKILLPVLSSMNLPAAALAFIAAYLLIWRQKSMFLTLLVCCVPGVAWDIGARWI